MPRYEISIFNYDAQAYQCVAQCLTREAKEAVFRLLFGFVIPPGVRVHVEEKP